MKLRKTKQYIDVNSADAKAMLDYRKYCANLTDYELMSEWSSRVQGVLREYVKNAEKFTEAKDFLDLLNLAPWIFRDHPLDPLAGKRFQIINSEYDQRLNLRINNNNTIGVYLDT